MEKVAKHKLLSKPEYMSASDFRPRFPSPRSHLLKPNTVRFLVAMIILLQDALVVCALGLAAEYGK